MRRLILLALVLLGSVALAQDDASPSSHEAAAVELLKVMGVEDSTLAGATMMIDVQIRVQPQLAPFRDVMIEWTKQYMTWDEIGPGMVKLYVESYTEDELGALATFYRSPVGVKSLEIMPDLLRKGGEWGQSIAMKYAPQLEQMIADRRKELAAEGK